LDFRLERRDNFSFSCRACGRCCSGKVIMAGPHEILGMSRRLGITTTEFLALYADNGGTTLRNGADGRCEFVTPDGCAVHPRRPLVCRLYPLGRATDGDGGERFAMFPRQEGCEADFGTDGTIADFLESQGVEPCFEWSRRYGAVFRRMLGLLERLGVEAKVETPAAGAAAGAAQALAAGTTPLSAWQDIDASLAAYCAAKGRAVPSGIEASIDLHLQAMEEWLDGLEGRAAVETPGEKKGKGRP
jgi:Fe-S-cluster containining protein